jgi:hypothetical protein
MNNSELIKKHIARIKKNKSGANFITVHSVEALNSKDEISFIRCNIPFSFENLEKVAELYNDSEDYYIQIHCSPYSVKVVC